MQRHEAVAILKEIINCNLAMPSIVALEKNKRGTFNLIMKADCDAKSIRQFTDEKNLTVELDNERGYCIISKR